MTKVYVVWHVHVFETSGDSSSGEDVEPAEDSKLLGIFTSRGRAEQCVSSSKLLNGFRDHPDGFIIDEYVLDRPCWTTGFKTELL